MIAYILWFLLWTFVIYWAHRLGHHLPFVKQIHTGHHKFIAKNLPPKWHWSNVFLFQDDWVSTADVWITEYIPTLLFCYFTGQWWIAIMFYMWAAFIQEDLEHNPRFNFYPLSTCGKWHLQHHHYGGKHNFGIFLPIWDIVFLTEKKVYENCRSEIKSRC